MKKAIRVDAEAEDEISHAIDRYEAEREGLGAEFWDEVRAAMQALEVPGPECGLPVSPMQSSSWNATPLSASSRSCMAIVALRTGSAASERHACRVGAATQAMTAAQDLRTGYLTSIRLRNNKPMYDGKKAKLGDLTLDETYARCTKLEVELKAKATSAAGS